MNVIQLDSNWKIKIHKVAQSNCIYSDDKYFKTWTVINLV